MMRESPVIETAFELKDDKYRAKKMETQDQIASSVWAITAMKKKMKKHRTHPFEGEEYKRSGLKRKSTVAMMRGQAVTVGYRCNSKKSKHWGREIKDSACTVSVIGVINTGYL